MDKWHDKECQKSEGDKNRRVDASQVFITSLIGKTILRHEKSFLRTFFSSLQSESSAEMFRLRRLPWSESSHDATKIVLLADDATDITNSSSHE